MRWKIKRFSNDELRQRMVDMTVPQAELIGLKMPDPDLKWNEEKEGMILRNKLEEFYQVIAGNGPCNKERLKFRNKAHDDGAWVREAWYTPINKKHKEHNYEENKKTGLFGKYLLGADKD